MTSCAAFGCTNRPSKHIPGITFHKFPANPALRQKWILAVRRKDWQPTENSRLCSKHFPEKEFYRYSLRVRLREDAVPTIFCFSSTSNSKKKLDQKLLQDESSLTEKNAENEDSTQKFIKSSLVEQSSPNEEDEFYQTKNANVESDLSTEAKSNCFKLLFEIIKSESNHSTQLSNERASENECSQLDNMDIENSLTTEIEEPYSLMEETHSITEETHSIRSSENIEESQIFDENQSSIEDDEIQPIDVRSMDPKIEIVSLKMMLLSYERKIQNLTEKQVIQKRKIKHLQQNVRRKDKKIKELSDLLFSRKNDSIMSSLNIS